MYLAGVHTGAYNYANTQWNVHATRSDTVRAEVREVVKWKPADLDVNGLLVELCGDLYRSQRQQSSLEGATLEQLSGSFLGPGDSNTVPKTW